LLSIRNDVAPNYSAARGPRGRSNSVITATAATAADQKKLDLVLQYEVLRPLGSVVVLHHTQIRIKPLHTSNRCNRTLRSRSYWNRSRASNCLLVYARGSI
jgi:hypothetical protein